MGGAAAAFVAFVVATVMIAVLMFVLGGAMALAQERFVETLRASVVQVKQWGGRVLILVGIWLIALGIWAEFFAQFFPV